MAVRVPMRWTLAKGLYRLGQDCSKKGHLGQGRRGPTRGREVEQQIPPLRSPGFPVEVSGVGELHAAFFTESRTRGRW
jgi:hypothetical protein